MNGLWLLGMVCIVAGAFLLAAAYTVPGLRPEDEEPGRG